VDVPVGVKLVARWSTGNVTISISDTIKAAQAIDTEQEQNRVESRIEGKEKKGRRRSDGDFIQEVSGE